jgi:hypothetical protein
MIPSFVNPKEAFKYEIGVAFRFTFASPIEKLH